MAAEAATTRPARKRATPAATVTKPAAKVTVSKPVAVPVEIATPVETQRFGFTMEKQADTKSYAKFTPPAGSGCVGTIYAPLGTDEVKVLMIGPASA